MISSQQVIDRYNKVYQTQHVDKTCYRNNGNGSSSSYDCGYDQQVLMGSTPIYATEYTYKIDRWKPSRTVNASGADRYPVWPQYTLANGGAQVIGSERVNSQNEKYSVKFINNADKKQYTLNTSLQGWNAYQIGGSYPLILNFRGDVVNDPLHPDNPFITATVSSPTLVIDSTDQADVVDTTPTPKQ